MTAASVRIALTALAAGIIAATPANASAGLPDPPVYVYSAKSGELGKGRLTLRGVGRRVTWATQGGRSGLTTLRRLHRLVFTPAAAPATATLHAAGKELVLRLTRPRYDRADRVARYRVRRIKRGRAPGQFGAASVSIVAPQVPEGAPTGNQCQVYLLNSSGAPLQLAAHSTQADTWSTLPGTLVNPDVTVRWGSYGAAGNGCSNTVTYSVLARPPVAFTVETAYPVSGAPTYTCTPSLPGNPQYSCRLGGAPSGGTASWELNWSPTPPPPG